MMGMLASGSETYLNLLRCDPMWLTRFHSRRATVRTASHVLRNSAPALPYRSIAEALECRTLLATVSFSTAITTTLNSGVFFSNNVAAVTGDINGDGIPDVIVSQGDGSAEVFLGTSTGLFTRTTAVGPGTQVMALADFNNDGNLDLATFQGILLGAGNGTFAAPKAILPMPQNTVALYAADLNGDGNQDLIAATYTPLSSSFQASTSGITVFLGKGDGTFQSPVSTVVSTNAGTNSAFAKALAFGDFNNDGKLDVVTPFGVLLGNGDGTFKTPPIALPFTTSTSGSPTPALPSAPLLALGDFNGDGNLDLATLPPTGTGEVEILLGTGKGTFTDNGPVTIITGDTITALDVDDVNGDGNLDLLAGVTTPSGASDVAVALGTGSATFGTPTLYPVAGPPVNISLGDFNGDGNLDILSLNAPAGSVLGTGSLPATSASVLLSNTPAATVPLVMIRASSTRVVDGTSVQYTVAVFAPPFVPGSTIPTSPPPVPTGVVSLFNDGTPLGTLPLVKGKATFKFIASGIGTQAITAAYSGDANYASANSAALNQTVLLTTANAPLLVPSLVSITLPSLFIPGDSGTVTLSLTNGGGGPANGKVAINLFLSADGLIDASSIPINVPSFLSRAILIGSGKTITLAAHFVAGKYVPGSYSIVAQITPISGITTDELTQSVLVSASTFQAAGLVFGNVGAHHGLPLTLTDSAGDRVTLTLSGPGLGTVTQNGDLVDISVTGTTTATRIATTALVGAFTFDTVTVAGALAGLNFKSSIITGSLTVHSNVTNVTLAGAGSAGGNPPMISLRGTTPVTLSLGAIQDATLNSTAPITSLTATSWQNGTINAPRIDTLTVKGEFSANVNVHSGGKLQTANITTLDGGTWAIAGGIGTLHVFGDLIDANIFAGADAGPDDVLGDSDDTYVAAAVASVIVNGADTSSLIVAGASPGPDGTLDSPLTLMPKGAIRAVTVRGAVSDDARFLAPSLPVRAVLDGTTIKTATDPHFAQ
jgi:hypothetical protein